jgi:pseudaminic acid cytidylyltransferase
MSAIAIIPARGGSKRIPGKNVREFAGKPIIAHSIITAVESGLFDEVMVSTDNEIIAETALQYGAKVPFYRSEENSSDMASIINVLLEVNEGYEKMGRRFPLSCCIFPTAPFVSKDMLERGLHLLEEKNYDTAFPIVPFGYPIQRSLEIGDGERLNMVWPEFLLYRSQDLPPRYHDTGLFYWYRTEVMKVERKLFGSNAGGLVISELECHDIDNPTDWEIAEIKFKRLKNSL